MRSSLEHVNHASFQRTAEPYRAELRLHCYRMMGSFHDAEDAVQDTFLRAWRAYSRFEGRSSLRSWLYKIATNACLSSLASKTRKALPTMEGPPTVDIPGNSPATEIAWIEPYPDEYLDSIPDTAPTPDVRYEMRETVQLAFVATIQYLPPRQRAVLLLADVMGWSAVEIANVLDSSTASVNSALQRARSTLKLKLPSEYAPKQLPSDSLHRDLIDRYVSAWERMDFDGFVSLLTEDTIWSMPPWREWYQGRVAIAAFFDYAWTSGSYASFRLVRTMANRQCALAIYKRASSDTQWHAHSIHSINFKDGAIAAITGFIEPKLFKIFNLPDVMD